MTDMHQAVYDAVRSKLSGCDIGSVIERVAYEAFDIGRVRDIIQQEAVIAFQAMGRPFVVLKPKLYPDGTAWCALLGDNIQEGLCGFGDTPSAAADAFDKEWYRQKTPQAMLAEEEHRR